ncbi:PH domain-containing protein [Myxococcus sp. AM009]|uniref:PH domain-containing protein n=1 Tax=unclassified Myxococcus TaxID=2648731 RepID=UPI001595DCCD|nr:MULTISPECIES: PH domain-containing protein [unclassified Myxococcus]NVI99658.1 PH domain-containing protein [Myxococcus sp. AM009]NVJ15810.1 PH domain-containing protein [Myxococcus sp. AM010]
MSDTRHAWLLRLLKVPPAPHIPEGRMVRVFRAAPRHRQYQLLHWALKQVGLTVSLLFGWVALRRFVPHLPFRWAEEVVWVVEAFAWLAFIVQLPISFLVAWLDYEFRWYILSDRSLRIREGLVSLQEKTMTFANIQQVSIRQNPLQRVLGIANVKVETAGGGGRGSQEADAAHTEGLHEAHFRGVNNPEEIRDVIMTRVRMHRDAGLGEPQPPEPALPPSAPPSATTHAAAQELLAEVRALRSTWSKQGPAES